MSLRAEGPTLTGEPRACSTIGLADPFLLLVAAAGLAGLLGLARTLEPDPRGFGTHTQLGMRPCSFATLTGRLCPTCGMTTSFAWFVRGRIGRSWQANPAGCLFALLTVPLIAWLVGSAVENQPVGVRSFQGPCWPAGCGRRSQPRVLVDSIDRFARRSGRAGTTSRSRGRDDGL